METTFVYGGLKGEVYMKYPKGIVEIEKDKVHHENRSRHYAIAYGLNVIHPMSQIIL